MPGGARVIVLYEDKAKKCFGLHKLLVACVADNRGGTYSETSALIDGRPLGGNEEVLKACRERFEEVTRSGLPVVALLDNDRIRTAIGVKKNASDTAVRAAITKRCPQPRLLKVVLLEQNAESVVRAARDAGVKASVARYEKALGKSGRGSPEARDGILDELALRGAPMDRKNLLACSPSFAEFVASVAAHLR